MYRIAQEISVIKKSTFWKKKMRISNTLIPELRSFLSPSFEFHNFPLCGKRSVVDTVMVYQLLIDHYPRLPRHSSKVILTSYYQDLRD